MEPLVFERAPIPAPPARPPAAVPLPVVVNTPSSPPPRQQQSLAAVFAAEESGLLRFAISIVRQRSIAEELVQETFLRLHQVWGEVEHPRAWLFRSLRNLALNHLRDRPKESELVEETAAAEAALPVEEMGRGEAIGLVRMLMAEMSEEDRELVRLKYLEGLKYQEIARRTGLSVGNVGYRLHHLLKGLADALRRAGIDGSRG